MEPSTNCNDSIGVFDSGVGGLTVLKQLIKALPDESFTYLGDTARLPYGEKSREKILRYSIENALFLMERNVKMLVVACNTMSAYALDRLQQIFSIPIVGVIEPGAERAIQVSLDKHIAVMGTTATVRSEVYQKALLKREPKAVILPIACPLLVPLVEEHYIDHPAALLIIQEYLKPLKQQSVDTVLLGCTHYPLLKHLICKEMGDSVAVVDSAITCAEKVTATLNENRLKKRNFQPPIHHFYVSDDPEKFRFLGRQFLDMPIEHVHLMHHL